MDDSPPDIFLLIALALGMVALLMKVGLALLLPLILTALHLSRI